MHCAGLPGDSCAGILLSCSRPLMLLGAPCRWSVGLTVRVGEAAVEAWLDFRDTGSSTGRVVASGLPVQQCKSVLFRILARLEDEPWRLIVVRRSSCGDEAVFTLSGLVSGD